MDQTIGSTKVDESSKVGDAVDHALDNLAFCQLFEQALLLKALIRPMSLALGKDESPSPAVHLNDLQPGHLADHLFEPCPAICFTHTPWQAYDVRERDKTSDSSKADRQTSPVVARDLCLVNLTTLEQLFSLDPILGQACFMNRDWDVPFVASHTKDKHRNLIPYLELLHLGTMQLVEVISGGKALTLEADVDQSSLRSYLDDGTTPNVPRSGGAVVLMFF